MAKARTFAIGLARPIGNARQGQFREISQGPFLG